MTSAKFIAPYKDAFFEVDVDDSAPTSERIAYLEEELRAMKKQLESLTEQLFGSITILCLPLPRGRRLEIGFKQIGSLPNGVLGVIVRRYIAESRISDLSLDEMLSPSLRSLDLKGRGRSSGATTCAMRMGNTQF